MSDSVRSIRGSTMIKRSVNRTLNSPMECYFPEAEPPCPEIEVSETELDRFEMIYRTNTRDSCPNMTAFAGGHYSNVRAATTKYLFTRVSDIVQAEGERQLNILFGKLGTGVVPKNLITVHIRWGDKHAEMELVPIAMYMKAIQQILDDRKAQKRRNERNDVEKDVHIYLATEDPQAYEEFMNAKPRHWNVYIDQYYVEMLSYRLEYGASNIHYYAAKGSLAGRNGLIAFGSLLVAMESNDFVLTTASNWSRLMNEIRKNIIDPQCHYHNNCTTTMIDLLYDEL